MSQERQGIAVCTTAKAPSSKPAGASQPLKRVLLQSVTDRAPEWRRPSLAVFPVVAGRKQREPFEDGGELGSFCSGEAIPPLEVVHHFQVPWK